MFFCNSGAEANEACFKLARKYAADHYGPQKNVIVSTRNSFHGRTLFTVSVGGQPKYVEGFLPAPSGIRHCTFNDIDSLKEAMGDDVAAIVLEPVQGEGGVLPATRAFLKAARELADQFNALLVFDEVQTGVGRTGALYAYMEYGVTPDLLSSAKALGGGFPIGAMLATARAAASFVVGPHGSTYGGNPLATAVGLRAVEVINPPAVLGGVRAKGQRFIDGLNAINAEYKVFREVRGMGLLLGAVLAEEYAGRAKDFVKAAEKQGLMVLVAGTNVVRFAPSLVIPEQDIDEGLARFKAAVASIAAK